MKEAPVAGKGKTLIVRHRGEGTFEVIVGKTFKKGDNGTRVVDSPGTNLRWGPDKDQFREIYPDAPSEEVEVTEEVWEQAMKLTAIKNLVDQGILRPGRAS
jgi:hypothetical protein